MSGGGGVPHPRSGRGVPPLPPWPGLDGVPPWTWDGVPPQPDLGWGTPPWTWDRVPPRPGMGYPPRPETGYPPDLGHSEHLLRDGRYASCVHAGGLSSSVWIFLKNSYRQNPQSNWLLTPLSRQLHLSHLSLISYVSVRLDESNVVFNFKRAN